MKNGLNITPHSNNLKPLITIIVLTYNNQDKLCGTISSILSQDYENIELIISDDCSNLFNIQKILEYISENKQSNIKSYKVLKNDKNIGTVAHANKVIMQANGSYIKYLSSGDGFYNNNSLSTLYDFAKIYKEDVVSSISIVCNDTFGEKYYYFPSKRKAKIINNSTPEKLYRILASSNIISAGGTMFRKTFFEKGFNESYRYLEDWPTWLELCRKNNRIPCLAQITAYYSIGGISSENGTAFESKLLKNDMILCYEKEILPFLKNVSILEKEYIKYQYKKLKYYDSMNLINKIVFKSRFIFIAFYLFLKKKIKFLIIRERG